MRGCVGSCGSGAALGHSRGEVGLNRTQVAEHWEKKVMDHIKLGISGGEPGKNSGRSPQGIYLWTWAELRWWFS